MSDENALRQSQGPDQCRGSLRCLEFHDDSVGDLGGHYNCCCCNPCRHIFATVSWWPIQAKQVACCKCVPRAIYLRFTPDDPENICCRYAAVPMYVRPYADLNLPEYVGVIHGVVVTVVIQRASGDEYDYGSGYDEYEGECAWIVTAARTSYGKLPDVDYSDTFLIDHETTTCLKVPEISIPVMGPKGCPGVLSLDDIGQLRLPFYEDAETALFAAHRNPSYDPHCDPAYDGSGELIDKPECDESYINLYDPCGPCDVVTSRLCVGGTQKDRLTFRWFEEEEYDEYYGLVRGWQVTNPATQEVERVLLQDDGSGGCVLVPTFTVPVRQRNGEIYDVELNPLQVDPARRCACGLHGQFTSDIIKGEFGTIYVIVPFHAGFCSCWGFTCGDCRCVPPQLCLMLFDGYELLSNIILTWDAVNNRWGGGYPGDYGYEYGDDGYGYDEDGLYIELVSDGAGHCIYVPRLPFWWEPGSAYPIRDCEGEHITGNLVPENDVVQVSMGGIRPGEYGEPDRYVWLFAQSMQLECKPGNCNYATPCVDECKSHPSALMITILLRDKVPRYEYGDEYDWDDLGSYDVRVSYWEIPPGPSADPLQPHPGCGYTGFLTLGATVSASCLVDGKYVTPSPCGTWRLDYGGGILSISQTLEGQCGAFQNSWAEIEMNAAPITCDPYYAESHWTNDIVAFAACFGLVPAMPEGTKWAKFIVTEV